MAERKQAKGTGRERRREPEREGSYLLKQLQSKTVGAVKYLLVLSKVLSPLLPHCASSRHLVNSSSFYGPLSTDAHQPKGKLQLFHRK